MSQPPPPSRQVLRARILWFLVGAVVNYCLISVPFNWLQHHTDLSVEAIAACAVGFSTIFFFVWNYRVNFRTEARRRDALARYVCAVACMWFLSSRLLAFLKHHDFHHALGVFGHALDLDVIATQFALGGLKFVLYHFWVFPRSKTPMVQDVLAPVPDSNPTP